MKKPISLHLLLCGTWYTGNASGEIESGKTSEALQNALRAEYATSSTLLSYRPSREKRLGVNGKNN